MNIKKFKKAGKKAIASALILGLGAGVFAGCGSLYEFNENAYNALYIDEDRASAEYKREDFDAIERAENMLNMLFKEKYYFGDMVDDFDEITIHDICPASAYYGQESTSTDNLAIIVRTFKGGDIKDWALFMPDILTPTDKDGNKDYTVYYDFYKHENYYNFVRTIMYNIDNGALPISDFKVVSLETDIVNELRNEFKRSVNNFLKTYYTNSMYLNRNYSVYAFPQTMGEFEVQLSSAKYGEFYYNSVSDDYDKSQYDLKHMYIDLGNVYLDVEWYIVKWENERRCVSIEMGPKYAALLYNQETGSFIENRHEAQLSCFLSGAEAAECYRALEEIYEEIVTGEMRNDFQLNTNDTYLGKNIRLPINELFVRDEETYKYFSNVIEKVYGYAKEYEANEEHSISRLYPIPGKTLAYDFVQGRYNNWLVANGKNKETVNVENENSR